MTSSRLCLRTRDSAATAAAVLLVGTLLQSPSENTLAAKTYIMYNYYSFTIAKYGNTLYTVELLIKDTLNKGHLSILIPIIPVHFNF